MKEAFDVTLMKHEESDHTITSNTKNEVSGVKSEGGKIGGGHRNRIFSKPTTNANNHSAAEDSLVKSNFDEERKYMSVRVNQMKEEYHRRIELLQNNENPLLGQIKKLHEENVMLRSRLEGKDVPAPIVDNSKLEVSQENIETVLQAAKRKQLLVKFVTQWLSFSFKKNLKNTRNSAMLKNLAFGVWRMRQYDPSLFGKAIDLTNEQYDPAVEKLWVARTDKEKKDKLFPYVLTTLT